jgi:Leucine-rich repeat (LRR) protein
MLDLSNNAIGARDSLGVISLAQGLKFLEDLQYFNIQRQNPLLNSTYIAILNEALNYTSVKNPVQLTLATLQDVATFFSTLPTTTTFLNLSGLVENSPGVIQAIMDQLRNYHFLTSLDLSGNSIGGRDSQGAIAIGNGLQYLTSLTSLDLSRNFIGWTDSQGEVAIGNGLRNLTSLTSLDLSSNRIGDTDSQGEVTIGNGLRNLTSLTSLDLSDNRIGDADSQGTTAIGNSLRNLTSLTSLDLSRNMIGVINSQGVVAIGNGLQYLTSLTSLDLSGNRIEYIDSQGTTAIGNGLRNLTSLTLLDLSGTNYHSNYIGYTDSQGAIAIGNSLGNLTNLGTLRLSNNAIGSTDGKGSLAILLSLPKLQQLKVLDLRNMTNITWVEAAEALAGLNRDRLRKACEQELCFAKPIRSQQPSGYLGETQLVPMNHHTTSSLTISYSNTSNTLTPPEIDDQLTFDITQERDENLMNLPLMTSAAVEVSRPAGFWKFMVQSVDYSKSWFSLDAWVKSISQAAYNLAIEKDADGQLINTMPATFPNLLTSDVYGFVMPINQAQLLLNGTSLSGTDCVIPPATVVWPEIVGK